MAWPENGTENWNPSMLDFVSTEHNTDGTHDLATIGWTETAVIVKDMTDTDGTTDTVNTLSFQPRLVIFFASVSGTEAASWGADDGTVANNINQREGGTMASSAANSLSFTVNVSSNHKVDGKITALSSTGFTVTWEKSNSPTGTSTIIALCFK